MRRITICFFCLMTLVVLGSPPSYAQADPSARALPSQDKLMKELVEEVRQLRMDLNQMNINTHRAHLVMERLKLQQERVARLSVELARVNTEIADLKFAKAELKERIEGLEKKFETGLIPDTEVKGAKAAMEHILQREKSLTEREPQLSTELGIERGSLEALNARLDEIEREILTIGKKRER